MDIIVKAPKKKLKYFQKQFSHLEAEKLCFSPFNKLKENSNKQTWRDSLNARYTEGRDPKDKRW